MADIERPFNMSEAEKREIATAYLTDPGLDSITACSRRFNRSRESIRQCLRGEAYEALVRAVNEAGATEARRLLLKHAKSAAVSWTAAIPVAAEKGDHRPAKDLLLHTGVIKPVAELVSTAQLVVLVDVYMPGVNQAEIAAAAANSGVLDADALIVELDAVVPDSAEKSVTRPEELDEPIDDYDNTPTLPHV